MSIQNLYPNIKPSLLLDFANSKEIDPRITASRASTATYYGTRTAKAEENLLTQSGNVAAWSQFFGLGSVTANSTTAPDGTTTAGFVPVNSDTSRHFVGSRRGGIAPIGSTITGSVFLKASTYGFASVQLSNATVSVGTPRYAISVDLSNGTIGGFTGSTSVSGQTASAISVGNGWYRVILTMTTTNAGDGDGINILVTPMPTDGSGFSDGGAILPSFTGDGASGIFVWGAQAEIRSAATAYTPTTTQPITNYIPVLETAANNVLRLDHNPTTFESLGLLIEEQRTNLFERSQEFDNAYWTKVRASITANTIVAPDGTLTADKLVEDTTATNSHDVRRSITGLTAGVVYTVTMYAKKAERTAFGIYAAFSSASQVTYFNLANGTIGTVSPNATATMQDVGNGFYRCSVTVTANATSGTLVFYITDGTTGDASAYTGDGYSGIYIWGAQLEAGAFATSYIPTVASQVTRAADAASMTGANFSSWYNAGEGTLYSETKRPLGSRGSFTVDDGTDNNRIVLSNNIDNTNTALITYAGVSQSNFNLGTNSQSFDKSSMAYKFNDIAGVQNNGAVGTDTSANIPTVNSMRLGVAGGGPGSCHYKKIAYYPVRIQNNQLQALTS